MSSATREELALADVLDREMRERTGIGVGDDLALAVVRAQLAVQATLRAQR